MKKLSQKVKRIFSDNRIYGLLMSKATMFNLNFSLDNHKIAQCNCLPIIIGKPVDSYQQACPQLSAGLLTIVGSKIDRDFYGMFLKDLN